MAVTVHKSLHIYVRLSRCLSAFEVRNVACATPSQKANSRAKTDVAEQNNCIPELISVKENLLAHSSHLPLDPAGVE